MGSIPSMSVSATNVDNHLVVDLNIKVLLLWFGLTESSFKTVNYYQESIAISLCSADLNLEIC
jgi:hypothetical protein